MAEANPTNKSDDDPTKMSDKDPTKMFDEEPTMMSDAYATKMSDEDTTKMCGNCRAIITEEGTYCLVCSEVSCSDSCEVIYNSSKCSRAHELQPSEESHILSIQQKELISSIMECRSHKTEIVTRFCVNHTHAICILCSTLKHRNCNTKDLKQISKSANKKNNVFQFIKKLKCVLSESKEITNSREEVKTLIENQSRECFLEVTKIKQQIIALAEKLAKDMEEQISNAKNQLMADMEKDDKALIAIIKDMKRIYSSFETLEQGIDDAAFVLMMNEKENIEDEIERKGEILKQVKRVTLEVQRSDELETMMSEITSMGRLVIQESQISKSDIVERREHLLSFQDISSTANMVAIEEGANSIRGCVFMPYGKLVVCDESNESVKVFTLDFKLKNELYIGTPVWDVAAMSNNKVIVTLPGLKSLLFVVLSDEMKKGKSISVGMMCRRIDCKNGKIYVCCHEDDGKGAEVKVLTMDGVIVNILPISQIHPYCLAVNSYGDRLIISAKLNESGNDGIVCIDNNGDAMSTYSGSHIGRSRGLVFDSYDNFIVCGVDAPFEKSAHNIHVVTSEGIKHKVLLTENDSVYNPQCLAFRPSDNTLVIGHHRSLLAFTMK